MPANIPKRASKLLVAATGLASVFLAGCATVGSSLTSQSPDFVILGSSTAAGTGAESYSSSWAGLLTGSMETECPDKHLTNLAVSGFTTWHIMPNAANRPASRPRTDMGKGIEKALALNPSLVIIQMNSNDPAHGYPSSETIGNHRQLVDSLVAHGIDIIEIGPFPRLVSDENYWIMKTLRDSLLEVVPTDSRLGVWDSLSLDGRTVKPKFGTGDGVHLNDSGHALIHRLLLRNRTWKKVCKS